MRMRYLIHLVENMENDGMYQAQALFNKTKDTAKKLGMIDRSFNGPWNQEWVELFKASINADRADYEEDQKQERIDHDEDGQPFVEKPYPLQLRLPDLLLSFWQNKINVLGEIDLDLRHAEQQYRKYHPHTELSDAITALHNEGDFIRTIRKCDGLSDINGMNITLDAIMALVNDNKRLYDNDLYFNGGLVCDGIYHLIHSGFPLIIAFCKMLGAH